MFDSESNKSLESDVNPTLKLTILIGILLPVIFYCTSRLTSSQRDSGSQLYP